MRKLELLGIFLLVAGASEARAISVVSGSGAVTSIFDPNVTQPRLQLLADENENVGDGSVIRVDLPEDCTFEVVIDFLDDLPPDAYGNLLLSVALASGVDYTGVSIRADIGGQIATLSYDAGVFTAAPSFGLPAYIEGIGNDGFLNLNQAVAAAFDLETRLVRGVNDPLTLTISVSGLKNIDQLVRFDVFGLSDNGQVVVGNNLNYGSVGVRPVPEAAALTLYLAGLGIAGACLRRKLLA